MLETEFAPICASTAGCGSLLASAPTPTGPAHAARLFLETERRDVADRLARLLDRSGGRAASGRFVVERSTREPERTHVFEACRWRARDCRLDLLAVRIVDDQEAHGITSLAMRLCRG
jgi:hypothetical protein